MKIGVFDSGVGGLSMANAIRAAMPEADILLEQDKEHVPYGLRQPREILGLVSPIFQSMIDQGCKVIVVACTTVATTLMDELRSRFDVPVIAVCATPTTLASDRYARLKEEYAGDLTVLEPDCSDWAAMIEHSRVETDRIDERVNSVLEKNADVIVLACTHYHWIEEEINVLAAGKARVIQPEPATIEQLKRVLARL